MWRTPITQQSTILWNQAKTALTPEQNNDNTETEHITASGDNLTGEVSVAGDMIESTGLVDTTTDIPLSGSGDIALTYGQLIPYIMNKYGMTSTGKSEIDFVNFPRHDNRYEAFKTAYHNRFFSRSVNPEKLVSCDNYVVFIGLAEKWPLSYTAANVYSVFRDEATRR